MEKIILSCIAVVFGLLVAGIAFYFYESSKVVPAGKIKTIAVITPTPTPTSDIVLTISQPANESVVTTKTITVAGKTLPGATVVVSSSGSDVVVVPSQTGDFSTTITLDSGTNRIIVTGISPKGFELEKMLTVTYSTEDF